MIEPLNHSRSLYPSRSLAYEEWGRELAGQEGFWTGGQREIVTARDRDRSL